MAARWKYLDELQIYGDPSVAYGQELLAEGFNTHLNSRVTEGWELVSADYPRVQSDGGSTSFGDVRPAVGRALQVTA